MKVPSFWREMDQGYPVLTFSLIYTCTEVLCGQQPSYLADLVGGCLFSYWDDM